jgi:hypothetical protein
MTSPPATLNVKLIANLMGIDSPGCYFFINTPQMRHLIF